MSENARAILHGITILAVVILASFGHEQIAVGLATGTMLPSPVSTGVKAIQDRRAAG